MADDDDKVYKFLAQNLINNLCRNQQILKQFSFGFFNQKEQNKLI